MSARVEGGNDDAKPAVHKLARRPAVKRLISGIVYDGTSGVLTIHLEDATKDALEYARQKSIDFVLFLGTTHLSGLDMGHPIVLRIPLSEAIPCFDLITSRLVSLGALRDIRIRSTKLPSGGGA